jgi:hypothetical protein
VAALLDVKVLIALFDPAHVHHEDAHAWFGKHRGHGWATCTALRRVGYALSDMPSSAEQLPECTRRQDGQRRLLGDGEKIVVSSDEHVGAAGHGGCENPSIGWIPNVDRTRFRGSRNGLEPGEYVHDGLNLRLREMELSLEHATQLGEDDLAENQCVFRKDGAEDVRAESARGEGGHQDVGVEADPHEMALKMSSSVR